MLNYYKNVTFQKITELFKILLELGCSCCCKAGKTVSPVLFSTMSALSIFKSFSRYQLFSKRFYRIPIKTFGNLYNFLKLLRKFFLVNRSRRKSRFSHFLHLFCSSVSRLTYLLALDPLQQL